MHDDVIREGTAVDPINTWGPYSYDIRKNYVELFLASQPISLRQFAERYGINRKTLAKWVYIYEGMAPGPGTDRYPARKGKTVLGPDQTAGRPPVPDDADALRTVTIPYTEYLALLDAKARLSAIQAVCQ